MRRLIRLELATLLREGNSTFLFGVLLLACVLAFVEGRGLMIKQMDGRASAASESTRIHESLIERFSTDLAPEESILSPFRVRQVIVAPLPPLVDFSGGRVNSEPIASTISIRSRGDTMFNRSPLTNPEISARGIFDLAFVALVIAPMVLIALGYGVFARDRDTGAARLLLAQTGSPVTLLIIRGLLRLGLVFAPIIATGALLLLFGPKIPGRALAATQWLLIVFLMLCFWWTVILLVNSLRVTAETSALSLVALWATLTLVLPPLINASTHLAYPPPSRFEEIAEARAAEIASGAAYDNDHPEVASGVLESRLASIRKSVEVGRRVEQAVLPIATEFRLRRIQQQRLARTLGWLSPVVIAGDTMADVAGTDGRRALAFRISAVEHLSAFKAPLVATVENGGFMTLADYRELPPYVFKPEPQSRLPSYLVLALLTLLLGGTAFRRFKSIQLN